MVPLNIPPGVSLGHHQSKARILEGKAEQQLPGGCGWQDLSFELALVCFYLDLIETTLKPCTPGGQEKKKKKKKIIPLSPDGQSLHLEKEKHLYLPVPLITNDLHFKTNHL